jgi:hypothetical protein
MPSPVAKINANVIFCREFFVLHNTVAFCEDRRKLQLCVHIPLISGRPFVRRNAVTICEPDWISPLSIHKPLICGPLEIVRRECVVHFNLSARCEELCIFELCMGVSLIGYQFFSIALPSALTR